MEAKDCALCGRSFTPRNGAQKYCCRNEPEFAEKAKELTRANNLLRFFGITVDQYDAILDAQDGVCAICAKPPLTQRLAVEHDHETGEILGLCCSYCNRWLLGRHGRDPKKYDRAAEYLRNPPARGILPLDHIVPVLVRKRRRKKRKKKATGQAGLFP